MEQISLLHKNRKELRNFTDRIKIMKMVDAFYQEHVNDERALYMKDYKWMEVDLKTLHSGVD